MDDRHPAVLVVERRAAPQIWQYARSDRGVIVALAAIAPEIVAARGYLFVRAAEGRRIERPGGRRWRGGQLRRAAELEHQQPRKIGQRTFLARQDPAGR